MSGKKEEIEIFDMHPGVDARNEYCLRSGHNFIDVEIAGESPFVDETLTKVARYFQANKAWERGKVPSIDRKSYHVWHPENRMRTRSIFRTKADATEELSNNILKNVTVAYTKEEAFRFFYVETGGPDSPLDGLKPHKYTVWPYMTQELPKSSRVHIPAREQLVSVARDNDLFLPEANGFEDSLHEYHTPMLRTMEQKGKYGIAHLTLEATLENLSNHVANLSAQWKAGLVCVERIGVNPHHVGFWLGFYRVPWQQKDERA